MDIQGAHRCASGAEIDAFSLQFDVVCRVLSVQGEMASGTRDHVLYKGGWKTQPTVFVLMATLSECLVPQRIGYLGHTDVVKDV